MLFGDVGDAPVARPVFKMASVTDKLLEMPRVNGLQHPYEWHEAA
jgi:hypothetical protein